MTKQGEPGLMKLYDGAARQTRGFIDAVKDDQYDLPTPCTDWNVLQLMDHIIEDQALYASSLSENEAAAGPGRAHMASYDRLVVQLLGAVRSPGILERSLDSPIGAMTGAELLEGAFMDTLIHGWDLAKATGQDTTLPPELVEACFVMFEPKGDGMRESGIIGPRVPVEGGADTQTKLLGALGRKA